MPDTRLLLYRTPGIAAWALGAVGIVLVVFFVAILSAVQPRYYKRGMLALVSIPQRPRAEEVLHKIHHALKWWLIAKVIAMFIVGVLSWVGLLVLGVPLAATLAVIAAVLTFVPNFGPIISAIPAVLIALTQDLQTSVWVIVLYTSIQMLESYAITPRLQYNAISMPPAVLITAQLVLWTWAGVLGLIFATPLTAVALVLIRRGKSAHSGGVSGGQHSELCPGHMPPIYGLKAIAALAGRVCDDFAVQAGPLVLLWPLLGWSGLIYKSFVGSGPRCLVPRK